jgi:hypothetical protein
VPPTAIPVETVDTLATIVLAATSAPAATALPGSIIRTVPSTALPTLVVPPIVKAMWPWLVLLAGPIGGLVVGMRIRRQRRMTYTNQSVGQLLATADAVTRDANLKIMQNLAAKGLLTSELAAVAGIDIAQPAQRRVPHLPPLRLPRLRIGWPNRVRAHQVTRTLRALRVSMPSLPHRRQRPLTIDMTAMASAPANDDRMPHAAPLAASANAMAPVALVTDTTSAAPPAGRGMSGAQPDGTPERELPDVALPATLAGQDDALGAIEIERQPVADTDADPWTSEERARAVATVITEVSAEVGALGRGPLHSPIVALDTVSTSGDGQVRITIDQHPDEENLLIDMPERIISRRPTWRAAWRRDTLEVMVATDGGLPPIGGPLIVPVLTHGRGDKTTRFFPLASWRHLAFYGSDALGALHAALGSLLYAQPPSHLALAILDHSEIAPLYRNVAHLVPLPASPRETIEQLVQLIKRGPREDTRPLVLVVVEPDDTMLNLLFGIAARLQARPTTPVHLLIAQEHVSSAGRELYAMMPALILGGGRGSTAMLPGQGDWPKRGEARLIARGMRAEGRAITWDEGAIAATVAELRGQPTNLSPVLWDAPAWPNNLPADVLAIVEEPFSDDKATSEPENQVADAATVEDVGQDGQGVLTAGDANEFVANNEPVDSVDDRLAAEPLAGHVDEREQHQSLVPAAVDHQLGSSDASATDATTSATSEAVPRRRSTLYNRALDAGSADALPMHLAPALRTAESSVHESQLTAVSLPTTSAGAPPMVEPDNGFPVGPAPLGRVAMAELMARMLATPVIVAGQANELGVTKNRLVDLLKGAHKTEAKTLAEVLIVWFDQAGLLVEPTKPGRLRHPRALATTNLTEIAARLTSTPCPDKGTVTALWAESHEGRN